jgi:methylthioribose-1-phosphate isomerase
MSATGSRIELWGDETRPLLTGDRITLYIPSDRKEIDAEVRWRKSSAVGLRFTSAFRTPTRTYA